MKKLTSSLLAVAAFALLAGQVGAQVININFSKYTTPGLNVPKTEPGQGVLDDSGTIGVWNTLINIGVDTDLLDSDGKTTPVDIDIGITGSYFYDNTKLIILHDYIFLSSGVEGAFIKKPFTFSGLTAGAKYNVTFLGHGNIVGQKTRFSIGGIKKIIEPVNLYATTWTEGENYVTFRGVRADDNGEITGEWSNVSHRFAGLGGIQLATVPEPEVSDVKLAPVPEPEDPGVKLAPVPKPELFGLLAITGGGLLLFRRRL